MTTAAGPKRWKASKYFAQPRCQVANVAEGIGGVFFHLAGKQFVLLIDLKTQKEICVSVIKNGYWELI
jgi:hypothetical protein